MHFSNFLNFRSLNNSLELWIIFSWISLPKGIFWQNKKKLEFSWVSFDSRYSQKMALKCLEMTVIKTGIGGPLRPTLWDNNCYSTVTVCNFIHLRLITFCLRHNRIPAKKSCGRVKETDRNDEDTIPDATQWFVP